MPKYIKPMVAFQPMNLATGVSTNCAIAKTNAEYSCPVEVPGWGDAFTIFTSDTGCTLTTPNDQAGVCYEAPTADANVLGS